MMKEACYPPPARSSADAIRGVPPGLQEALHYGYIHPNLPQPSEVGMDKTMQLISRGGRCNVGGAGQRPCMCSVRGMSSCDSACSKRVTHSNT